MLSAARSTCRIIAFVGIIFLIVCVVQAERMRRWRDSTGKYSFNARLVSVEGDNVVLEGEDGKKRTVPLDKLSRVDRIYVKEYLAQKSREEKETEDAEKSQEDKPRNAVGRETPAPKNSRRRTNRPRSGNPERKRPREEGKIRDEIELPPKTDVRILSGAKPIHKMTMPEEWSYRPAELEVNGESGNGVANNISLAGLGGGPQSIVFSTPTPKYVAATSQVAFSTSDDYKMTSIEVLVFAMPSGRRTARFVLPPGVAIIALSDDGSRVLTEWTWKEVRLDVFDTNTGKHIVGWRPYPDAENEHLKGPSSKDLKPRLIWARFVDNDRVATYNKHGMLSLWKIPECEREYEVTGLKKLHFACFTIDGGALVTSKGGMFDLVEGKLLGRLPDFGGTMRGVVVSPDGSRIAATKLNGGDYELIVWDIANGRKISSQMEQPFAGSIRLWVTENYLIDRMSYHDKIKKSYSDGYYLKDIRTGRYLWLYKMWPSNPVRMIDGTVWTSLWVRKKFSYIFGLKIPDERVMNGIARGMSKLPEPIIKAGVTVRLDLRITGPAENRDAYLNDVRESLIAKLSEGDINVADQADITLRVTTSLGEEIGYGPGVSIAGFSVRAVHGKIEWVSSQGKVFWKSERDFTPSSINSGSTDMKKAAHKKMWEMAKPFLSGKRMPVVVFPFETGEKGRNTIVAGDVTITEEGEMIFSE